VALTSPKDGFPSKITFEDFLENTQAGVSLNIPLLPSRATIKMVGIKQPLTLPLVDFGLFLHGSQEERQFAARQLVDSFLNHGFVRLKNHGVSPELVQDIWKWVRRSFVVCNNMRETRLNFWVGETVLWHDRRAKDEDTA
jgi:hypothetical protein